MDIPRFNKESVNPRIAFADMGEAFQVFVHELLQSELGGLHRFPAGGKDGAIDLIYTSKGCQVIECKFVGDDDYSTILRRWISVKKLLEKHLSEETGPTTGQSQYGPWYSKVDPISEYWFCVSAEISNEDQRRGLHQSISDFFNQLASSRSHLSHLQGLKVVLLDWNDVTTRLKKRSHLIFRWFPGSRPSGLVPLDETAGVGTFRVYLTGGKLPYYSLADHLHSRSAFDGVGIPDEESLLERFDNPEITGLVINGKGGIGKSRLTLELGWIGLSKGWTVMRVVSKLKEDALERLTEKLAPDTTVLLIVDYIETQNDFGELVETLNVLNDSGVAQLRYVAACRTAYYHQVIASFSRHVSVDLTPPESEMLDRFADYRRQTVVKILSESGLESNDRYLAVCNDLPILAVFLVYLNQSGRSDDLAELLQEVEFGRWVAKRVQSTFPDRNVSRELAFLIALFPMAETTAHRLDHLHSLVLDRLATDGWVERLSEGENGSLDTWVTAHDVLADQILLSYLRGIPATAEMFVDQLLRMAVENDCLGSAIVSLQRVADVAPLNNIRWLRVILQAIDRDPAKWRGVRNLLLRTNLLTFTEQLSLLDGRERLWEAAQHDLGFQKVLGWLARKIVRDQEVIQSKLRDVVIDWITKTVPHADRSNFVITWGLRLTSETARTAALTWITAKPLLLQTHYVMVAWLGCGLPPETIAVYVGEWCQRFSNSFHLSFLVPAWLEAGGAKEVVQEAITAWLVEHQSDADAQFIYKAWLEAGGAREVVQQAITAWLVRHQSDAEARFIYKAWLEAGGAREAVQEAISAWLVQHQSDAEASHVYGAWLDAGGAREVVQEAIGAWLVEHQSDAEASHVYNAWLDAGGAKEVVEAAITAWLVEHQSDADAQFIYKAWLEAGGAREVVQQAITAWLVQHQSDAEASHVFSAWLNAEGDKSFVRADIASWLLKHAEDDDADHVFKSWLEADGERELVWHAALAWLGKHRSEESAVYVTKFIAKEEGLPVETIKDVLMWCRTFPHNEDALWRLTQLRENRFVSGIAEDLVLASEAVLEHLLQPNDQLHQVTLKQIAAVLFPLINSSEMQSESIKKRVNTLFISWLKNGQSVDKVPPFFSIQKSSFPQRVLLLLESGLIDINTDRASLVQFVKWLDTWDLDRKLAIVPTLDELRSKYPVPDLWNLVRLTE